MYYALCRKTAWLRLTCRWLVGWCVVLRWLKQLVECSIFLSISLDCYVNLMIRFSPKLWRNCCKNGPNPASFFVYFRSVQTQTYGKTVGFSWVRPCIVGVEGKLTDHLTTLFNAFYVKRVTLVYGCFFYLFFVSQPTFILNISLSLFAI